ncbi:hypothetical protein BDP27DRAFT_1370799 [Rhodocollybia butyracea]|uniref:Uncharacterized protein n=1 Tax=Rhodocollybia butyracea TaxID=206335 RepID=A0A9P5TZA1_9AGAR|nr:hypothetical protein BDP27DRAFT_1370799 [Rhodocollybia butyracea]
MCLIPTEREARQRLPNMLANPTRRTTFESLANLSSRLFAGKMILARKGTKYYYPCRLIAKSTRRAQGGDTWTIKWWRYANHSSAGQYELKVPISRLADALWENSAERRQIQLGEWKRAYIVHELNDEEESLTNPEARRFTTEIHHALVPHSPILSQLLHNPDAVSSDLVPAKRWAQTQRDIHGNAVPFCGLLTLNDQLSINNWYYKHIEDAYLEFEHNWELDADTIEHGSDLEQYIINQAWDKLVTFT